MINKDVREWNSKVRFTVLQFKEMERLPYAYCLPKGKCYLKLPDQTAPALTCEKGAPHQHERMVVSSKASMTGVNKTRMKRTVRKVEESLTRLGFKKHVCADIAN